MTRDEIKNTPELVDFMLDESIIADSRMKLHKRLEELCKLAIKALEQEPFINKPCVYSGVCEHDKNNVLDKMRAEIIKYECDCQLSINEYPSCKQCTDNVFETIYGIIDKYKAETER